MVVDESASGAEKPIVGCVGCEKLSDDRAELRRMSVDSQSRKGGLGSALVKVVDSCASRSVSGAGVS